MRTTMKILAWYNLLVVSLVIASNFRNLISGSENFFLYALIAVPVLIFSIMYLRGQKKFMKILAAYSLIFAILNVLYYVDSDNWEVYVVIRLTPLLVFPTLYFISRRMDKEVQDDMKKNPDTFDDNIVMHYAERGEGTGGLSKILSGLIFPLLTVLAVQMIKDQQFIPLVILAILMWSRFGIFFMAAGLVFFLGTQYWIGAAILAIYFPVAMLSFYLGKRNIKRLLVSGSPIISPFEGMNDLLYIIIFECLFLAVALFTHGWASIVFWCLFCLITIYHFIRYWGRLNPRWSQIHQPLMMRHAASIGFKMGQAEREGREYGFDFVDTTSAILKSVYPGKEDEEIKTMVDKVANKMDTFSDRNLIKQTMLKRNPSVPDDTIQKLLDKVEAHLKTPEGRNWSVRYTIAEIVEAVFGQEERGTYLLAVIEGNAN